MLYGKEITHSHLVDLNKHYILINMVLILTATTPFKLKKSTHFLKIDRPPSAVLPMATA
jgi:hypothetical protein